MFQDSPEGVLDRVNELVPVLRERAEETEQLRHMHPENLAALTEAGVFRLAMPRDVGGFEAEAGLINEVLAQIARGCPSTSWMSTLMVGSNMWPAFLGDEAGAEIYATPDLRITGLIAPTGSAVGVDGGFEVSGTWRWNTGGMHSNWVTLACMAATETGMEPVAALVPTEQVEIEDTWHASGMAGTATNTITGADIFVPASRVLRVADLAAGNFPQRRYSENRYYNRPALMMFVILSAPAMLGIARGAMDAYMERLPEAGITYTAYKEAREAPLTHHQLAHATFELEIAEMYTERLRGLLDQSLEGDVPMIARIRARAWLGQVATHARASVNQLFEASGASQIQHSAPIQRYFRDVNSLALHALIQPTTSDELYGRTLAGLEPNTTFY
ncbi:MAG: acyl-CoA dehydrogenase [Actinobacteria bacterium]|nr:acyl-CoA dehydrogenase [Actinomycetota bacterium]